MRYSGIVNEDIENGPGVGVSLFTQGCPHHCKNCFNPETWSYDGGKEFTEEDRNKLIKMLGKSYITRFSLLGGEPFIPENISTLLALINFIKKEYPHIKIWAWTGYTLVELLMRHDLTTNLLHMIDVLVDGPFIEEKKDLTLPYSGSTNQRVINLKETFAEGQVVLYKKNMGTN